MPVEPEQLKAFMVDANLIDEQTFDSLLKKSKEEDKNIEELLISGGFISEENLIKLKAYILGIPFINLEKEVIPPDILRIIPEPIARTYNIIAFKKSGKTLEVAMLNPEDLKTIDFIRKAGNFRILPRLTNKESIKNALRQYQESLEKEFGSIIKEETDNAKSIRLEESKEDQKDLEKAGQELPIVKIVDTLIKHAILQRASDIHIEPTEKEVLVRYRIDGILRDAMSLPLSVATGIVARIKILSNLKLDEHRLPQDGRFKFETLDTKYSIRVSILPVYFGEKIVMRLLPENSKGFTLEELGFWGEALEKVQLSIRKTAGMILATGPTGSGKTTTLYSLLEILNTPQVNISTVEDPIEYQIPRINQTQINPKIGLTFANCLRSLLRQDPDIIMVGEIRDEETASLAVNAALTGHLVLSTLHTNSAAGAIPRLLDMKCEPFLLSSTLNLVIAQRLVRRLNPEFKEKHRLSKAEINNISQLCDLEKIQELFRKENILKKNQTIESLEFFRPRDKEKGYKGRIGIYEVLRVTETIKELILKRASSDTIQEQAIKEGMILMVEDGFIKAARGITSIEEVLRVISE